MPRSHHIRTLRSLLDLANLAVHDEGLANLVVPEKGLASLDAPEEGLANLDTVVEKHPLRSEVGSENRHTYSRAAVFQRYTR